MLFGTALSHTLKASSIKVDLVGVRALHIEHGFDNPLANCLCLECILRGLDAYKVRGHDHVCLLP